MRNVTDVFRRLGDDVGGAKAAEHVFFRRSKFFAKFAHTRLWFFGGLSRDFAKNFDPRGSGGSPPPESANYDRQAEAMTTQKATKADPYLKTDEELLQIVMQRMSLPTDETGVSDLGIVEGAIGALFVGQRYGLRILRILHSAKTLGQYEKFLGVSFEDLIPQRGIFIDRSVAWWIATTTKKYWDVVYRRFKIEGDQRRGIVDGVL